MTTVKQVIEQKANTIFSVRSSDTVENVLMLMRDHRVRAILVVDDGALVGIVSQELNGAPWWLVAIPGITLIIGRLIHAKGINVPPPDFSKRVLGMKFTFYTLITLVVLNLGWALYKCIT